MFSSSTRFFELEPDAVGLFGYESHDRIECIESTSFNNHAKLVIRMFDKALGMLGPDTEVLVDNLVELGEKHFELGVKPVRFFIVTSIIKAARHQSPKVASTTTLDFLSSQASKLAIHSKLFHWPENNNLTNVSGWCASFLLAPLSTLFQEYYASMGHALTCALKSILGDKYSIDVGEAWVKFFLSMANAMILVQRRIEEKSIDSSQRSDRSSRSRHRHRQQEGSKRINSRN